MHKHLAVKRQIIYAHCCTNLTLILVLVSNAVDGFVLPQILFIETDQL